VEKKPILIVDDEKNFRLTMSQSLEPLGIPIHTAGNGEEALQKLREVQAGLVFLGPKLPGLDGMEVLSRIKERWPEIRVIMITDHGTIAAAVEAMKLGAVDFLQKPFSPGDIRELATQVLERESLQEESAADYPTLIALTKRHISDRKFDLASASARQAIATDPGQPEVYNLLGVLLELQGNRLEAQKFYRAALDIDPTYKPAWANLERATSFKVGTIDLGPDEQEGVP
jgi:FixJ family two-component response regulator